MRLSHVAYVYGYTFSINSAKTVKSITLPHNRNVVVLAIDVSARGAAPARVNLKDGDNVAGIVANGSPVSSGGLDNEGYAYSANLLGASLTWTGSTFTLGAPGSTTPRLQISGTPVTKAEVGQFY